jgi:hypothetical protein
MSNACIHEPAPTGDGDAVLFGVMKDLTDRAESGRKKYGTLLKTNNGRDALMDLYQELLDAVMYIKQKLMEIEEKEREVEL